MLNTNYERYSNVETKMYNYEIEKEDNKTYVIPKEDFYVEINNKADKSIFLIPSKNITFIGYYKLYINDKRNRKFS
ncbi:MAG: hypothetical protein L6V81_06405 [Clostridium sp.]|nr:MAG: hypothetical protein L6V81_06405 [Clostridium sp.]